MGFLIGQTLGHYRILDRLGEGGMGVVYKALDTKLNRPVAIKVLPPELTQDPERRLRFQREAQAAAALNHPNICTIHEVGEQEGVDYLVMEMLEGELLREKIGQRPMPLKAALPIAIQVGEALVAAHERQVLHRDLKPDNIFITARGAAKVLDFGLAKVLRPERDQPGRGGKPGSAQEPDVHSRLDTVSRELTLHGKVLGTVAYMSPEQTKGERATHQSDLFSFGVVLYEMATGRQPFRGRTDAELMASIIRDDPPPASASSGEVPPELDRIIAKCLEKDPLDRYHHADDLVTDLRRLKRTTDSGVQVVRAPSKAVATVPSGVWSRVGRARALRWALAGVVAAALVVAGTAAWRKLAPQPQFLSGDRIVVGDFENATGRTDLDTAIRDGFAERLSRSSYLQSFDRQEIADLMTARGGGTEVRVTPDVVAKLCRDGTCAGYLTGRVSAEGTGYRIEAELKRVGARVPVVASSMVSPDERGIVAAIHALSLEIRRGVGETPQAVSATPAPTTQSLSAYQLFAIAETLAFTRAEEQLPLYRRAVEIDPSFVDALTQLGNAQWNLGEFKEWRKTAEEAYRRSSGMPEQVRLKNEINFLEASYEYDTELERLKTYARLYPFDAEAPTFAAVLYGNVFNEPAEALFRDAYRIAPNQGNLFNLSGNLLSLGKVGEVENLAEELSRKSGSERDARTLMEDARLARRDWNGFETALAAEGSDANWGLYMGRLWTSMAAGRLTQAREALPAAWDAAVQKRHLAAQQDVESARTWLDLRAAGKPYGLTPQHLKPAAGMLLPLRDVAVLSVETRQVEPLARLVEGHAQAEKGSQNKFVLEELAFHLACLAYIRGQHAVSRDLLEPIARNSHVVSFHHVLARTYESLGQWREAAGEYEEVLMYPYRQWYLNPAIWALDRFQLAQVYERLGDPARAREWYQRFADDWKDADPDIPELLQVRERLTALGASATPARLD